MAGFLEGPNRDRLRLECRGATVVVPGWLAADVAAWAQTEARGPASHTGSARASTPGYVGVSTTPMRGTLSVASGSHSSLGTTLPSTTPSASLQVAATVHALMVAVVVTDRADARGPAAPTVVARLDRAAFTSDGVYTVRSRRLRVSDATTLAAPSQLIGHPPMNPDRLS